MESRTQFCHELAKENLKHVERGVALLWFYTEHQLYDERTAGDLAVDLHDEGFPKPNVTTLRGSLAKSKFTIKGKRAGTFQIDIRHLDELENKFGGMISLKRVKVTDKVLPKDWVDGTRIYLEKIVYQINGTYDYGFYDCCAVLCRRLMESLIIETYISAGRVSDIKNGGVFYFLDKLITTVENDVSFNLGRNTPKTMKLIKQMGDTAAHDRAYITHQRDIDDVKARYRRMIQELLQISGVTK